MELRAFRDGWKLPQEKREEIGQRLVRVVTGPKPYRVRYVISAAKALIGADLKQQEIDLKKQEPLLGLDEHLDEALDPPPEDAGDPGEVQG